MCGISGFWDFEQSITSERADNILRSMINTLEHRGPDDYGIWTNREQGIHLGHRRLSIYDLSPKGHQPMCSPSGRCQIIFNGSIYNYQELRHELEQFNIQWQSNTDTEVLLAAFEHWGIDQALSKLTGMFAIALYDQSEQQLILMRDRIGEKPLYYGLQNNYLVFASELKAIKKFPEFNFNLQQEAIALQPKYCYIPAPYSIYQDIYKLEPGNYISISKDKQIKKYQYWDFSQVYTQTKQQIELPEALQ